MLEENFNKAKAVLAAHKIALWEYDMQSGRIHFDEDYFHILGLEDAGIFYDSLEQVSKFIHPEDTNIFNPASFK